MTGILSALLLALSLCADCFAVSLSASLSIRRSRLTDIFRIGLVFGVIQTSLLMAGWWVGDLFVGLIHAIAHIAGFLLLLYVGGSMIMEAFGGDKEHHDLNGFRNVILGGFATSIDALAVGASLSLGGNDLPDMVPVAASVFAVTVVSVFAGMYAGIRIASRSGSRASSDVSYKGPTDLCHSSASSADALPDTVPEVLPEASAKSCKPCSRTASIVEICGGVVLILIGLKMLLCI